MLDSYPCPVCGRDDWSPVETYLYGKGGGAGSAGGRLGRIWRRLKRIARILALARPRGGTVTCGTLSAYQLLRRRVLFEVWFPSSQQVTLKAAYCAGCGFTAYSPRPSEADVAAKYHFLKEATPDSGGQVRQGASALASDEARAATVYRRCAAHLGSGRLRVLDYGGGNGKLLRPFLAAGHDCYLIDYNDNPLPGVTKICDDRRGFHGDHTFDLIICSHVFEHVSDIAGLALFLHDHMSPNGLIYVEVPQEIWAGLSIDTDPVTHINFFTPNSLTRLLVSNGFDPVETRQQFAAYGDTPLEVIWFLGRRGTAAAAAPAPDPSGRPTPGSLDLAYAPDVRALLHPSRVRSLVKMWRLRAALRRR